MQALKVCFKKKENEKQSKIRTVKLQNSGERKRTKLKQQMQAGAKEINLLFGKSFCAKENFVNKSFSYKMCVQSD